MGDRAGSIPVIRMNRNFLKILELLLIKQLQGFLILGFIKDLLMAKLSGAGLKPASPAIRFTRRKDYKCTNLACKA